MGSNFLTLCYSRRKMGRILISGVLMKSRQWYKYSKNNLRKKILSTLLILVLICPVFEPKGLKQLKNSQISQIMKYSK